MPSDRERPSPWLALPPGVVRRACRAVAGCGLAVCLAGCQTLPTGADLPPIPPSHTLTRLAPAPPAPVSPALPTPILLAETRPPAAAAEVAPTPEHAPPVREAVLPEVVATSPPSLVVPGAPAPAAVAVTREDALLLPLLQQEQSLLENFGPDHPQVKAVRARIAVVRDFLDQHPAAKEPTVAIEPPAADARFEPTDGGAKYLNLPSLFGTSIASRLSAEPEAPVHAPEPVAPLAPPAACPAPAAPPAVTATLSMAAAYFLATAAALLLGVVVQIVGLAYVLRRYVSTTPPPVPPTVVVTRTPVEGPVRTAPERRPPSGKEAGILQQVFEDNLRLHEELTAAM